MDKNQLLFGDEARQKLFVGVEKIYKAVSATLGARGKVVMTSSLYFPNQPTTHSS